MIIYKSETFKYLRILADLKELFEYNKIVVLLLLRNMFQFMKSKRLS